MPQRLCLKTTMDILHLTEPHHFKDKFLPYFTWINLNNSFIGCRLNDFPDIIYLFFWLMFSCDALFWLDLNSYNKTQFFLLTVGYTYSTDLTMSNSQWSCMTLGSLWQDIGTQLCFSVKCTFKVNAAVVQIVIWSHTMRIVPIGSSFSGLQ